MGRIQQVGVLEADLKVRTTANTFDIRAHLEEDLAACLGEYGPIRQVDRRTCPYSSSFHIDELNVRFEDGRGLKLVVKDLSHDGMLETARLARPEFLYDPQREIDVYRWILPHAPSGTAAWYGAEADPVSGRYWLLLERVRGLQLAHVGAFSAWEQTARWIARFHRSFRLGLGAHLRQQSNLLFYDAAFYWRWFDRAERFASRHAAKRRQIVRLTRQYERAVCRMLAMPQRLIHGELYACNVLVARNRHAVRICPVDWEMAAVGPHLIDLASLAAGWAERKRLALARAYLREWSANVRVSQQRLPSTFRVDLDCCRLFLAVRMLGWSEQWTPPPQQARDWLTEAVQLAERLKGSI